MNYRDNVDYWKKYYKEHKKTKEQLRQECLQRSFKRNGKFHPGLKFEYDFNKAKNFGAIK